MFYKLCAVDKLTHANNNAYSKEDVLDLQTQCDNKFTLFAYDDEVVEFDENEAEGCNAVVGTYVGERIYTVNNMGVFKYKNELYVETELYEEFIYNE